MTNAHEATAGGREKCIERAAKDLLSINFIQEQHRQQAKTEPLAPAVEDAFSNYYQDALNKAMQAMREALALPH